MREKNTIKLNDIINSKFEKGELDKKLIDIMVENGLEEVFYVNTNINIKEECLEKTFEIYITEKDYIRNLSNPISIIYLED